jgi:hypothetical protein
MVPRGSLQFLIAAVVVLACLAIPAAAPAAVAIDSYKITSNMPAFPTVPSDGPSTFQAGANPDAGSWSTFSYPNSSEDIKTALTNFAPGLLGNPESVPKCPQAALEAGGAACPAGSTIGTSRLDIILAATGAPPPGGSGLPSSLLGTLYNAEPLGNEPGRLAAVTPTGGAPLVSSIPFEITPRGGGDYGLTGTLTDINRLPANAFGPGSPNLQVKALGFVINASTKYVRNPTSCQFGISTGQAAGYDDPTFVDGPPYGFPTTGCDQVPFAPQTTLEIGDRGNTAFNRYPPFKLTITQPPGQADQLGNKITLPVELNTNNPAYKLCTQAQADADSCPDDSKFGGVAAKSPFLAEELRGPIYLIQQTNTSLPGLLLDLRGRVHVKIQTQTTLVNNRAIQSLVLNAPQLPVSELRVGLNGGRNTGVFLNRQNLCFRGESSWRFNDVSGLIKDYGRNGTTTAEQKLKAKVNGCGPGVRGRISRATRRTPLVRLEVDKHPDAPNFKELTVSLSRNLRLVKSRFKRGARATEDVDVEYVSRRRLRVTGFPAAGDADVTVLLRRGAVRVSNRSRNVLNRGRTRTFRAKVRQTPVTGAATSTKASFRARGSRR